MPWRIAAHDDWPHIDSLIIRHESFAVSIADRVIQSRQHGKVCNWFGFRTATVYIHHDNGGRLDAVLCLCQGGCVMPLVDEGVIDTLSPMRELRSMPAVRFLRPTSCVGGAGAVLALESALGWRPAISTDFKAMKMDAREFRPPDARMLRVLGCPVTRRAASPDDLTALLPVAEAYDREEVATSLHGFDRMAVRASQARSLALHRVRILELGVRVVARAQVNAMGFERDQIGGVYVVPELRGLGLGRAVVVDLIKEIVASGRGLALFVKQANTQAIGLYRDLGFTFSGDLKVDYFV
jgi:ribosomal protein S18 acetylase RimI-like enzyme